MNIDMDKVRECSSLVAVQLEALVRAGTMMRQTPIVDDGFPMRLHNFDAELALAKAVLKELRRG